MALKIKFLNDESIMHNFFSFKIDWKKDRSEIGKIICIKMN